MCGIVYCKSFKDRDVTDTIISRFKAQRSRGTTSFGFYLTKQNRLTHNVRERRIKRLMKRTRGHNSEILFHHRLSTSTIDVRNACHPFSTKNYFDHQYIGVHNGMIHNDEALRKEHEALGINYVSTQPNGTFNDSEALIYDLARFCEGQVESISAVGSVAFVMVKRKDDKPVSVLFGRNYGSPLKMRLTKGSLTLASEGEGEEVNPNTLYEYTYETGTLTTKPMTIASYQWVDNRLDKEDDFGFYYRDGLKSSRAIDLDDEEEDKNIYWPAIKTDNKKFSTRSGSWYSIRTQVLKTNNFNYAAAALALEMEAMECNAELKRLEDKSQRLMELKANERCIEKVWEYWSAVSSYAELIISIADDLDSIGRNKYVGSIQE